MTASSSSITAWQPRRDVGVRPGALSSGASSVSWASERRSNPFSTTTWHVVHAQLPPHACSSGTPLARSTSRIEPGRPSCWKGARRRSTSITRSGSPFSNRTITFAIDWSGSSRGFRTERTLPISGDSAGVWCRPHEMAIHYEPDGPIVTTPIDRPEARNSLDLEHFGALADSWVRFRDDDDAFVAILTGVKDVYCVGADLKRFIPIVTERADKLAAGESMQQVGDSRYTMAHSLVAVLRDGAILPETGEGVRLCEPGIAARNGICAARRLEMMWNTDLGVCAEDAWFQLAEPRRGLFPGGGSTVHSARQLSWCNAMEVVLLADRISAQRALEMGLVNRIVPRDRVMDEARALAATICLNGPLAVRACQQSAK